MGLDMYLTKRTYIGNKYRKPKQQIRVVIPKNQKNVILSIKEIKNERISEITEELGYWRKANAIHKWFVDNVQNGNDDCKEYDVSREKLKELLSLVIKVLKDRSLAKKLLPTQKGFFFGDYEYDKCYFEDLKETEKIIEKALKEESGEIYYRSSW